MTKNSIKNQKLKFYYELLYKICLKFELLFHEFWTYGMGIIFAPHDWPKRPTSV
jgi:hypothetical protein